MRLPSCARDLPYSLPTMRLQAARQRLDALMTQRDQLAAELAAASAAADAAEAGTSLLLHELHMLEAGSASCQLQAHARVPLAGWRGTAGCSDGPAGRHLGGQLAS